MSTGVNEVKFPCEFFGRERIDGPIVAQYDYVVVQVFVVQAQAKFHVGHNLAVVENLVGERLAWAGRHDLDVRVAVLADSLELLQGYGH